MKVKEPLNVIFNKSPPPTKLSPLVGDDVGKEEAIKRNIKVVNNNNKEDESIEFEEIVNIKESKNHLLDQVTGNRNQRTLSTWMEFRGNTRDLGSFEEETEEITNLHQIHEEILFSERGDDITGIKRRRRDPSSDDVRDLVTAPRCCRLNEDLESSI
nr:hypothetical protein CTI12_AA182560 [Tanacetum cinerariifolium]